MTKKTGKKLINHHNICKISERPFVIYEEKVKKFSDLDDSWMDPKDGLIENSESERLLTVKDLKHKLKMSENGIRKLVHKGIIPSHKVGSSLRFNWDEVLQATRSTKFNGT